jgi:hypothetical protein
MMNQSVTAVEHTNPKNTSPVDNVMMISLPCTTNQTVAVSITTNTTTNNDNIDNIQPKRTGKRRKQKKKGKKDQKPKPLVTNFTHYLSHVPKSGTSFAFGTIGSLLFVMECTGMERIKITEFDTTTLPSV